MGMGYGYVEHSSTPDICFNYLGDFDEGNTQNICNYSSGLGIAKENDGLDNILINGLVFNGVLSLNVTCREKYGQKFAKELKVAFKSSVEELIDYCCNFTNEELTISDLDSDSINMDNLDAINDFLELI